MGKAISEERLAPLLADNRLDVGLLEEGGQNNVTAIPADEAMIFF